MEFHKDLTCFNDRTAVCLMYVSLRKVAANSEKGGWFL